MLKFKAFLLVSIFLFSSQAWACSCDIPNREKSMASATVVFEGRAEAIVPIEGYGEQVTTFVVDKVIKGEIGEKIKVKTNISLKSCGWTFTLGKKTTVAAYGDGKEGFYHTSSCTMDAFDKMDDI